jgi:glycosyltransferase involved in cell wall biosynthesis
LRASLKIIGKGNESHFLEEMSSVDERIVFLGEKDREEVWGELEKCHVGILPMPESKIWRTSSPLKLAEYLAAGLLVIGPRHPGNSIGGENRWELLSENSEWPESCIELVARTIESEDWGDISKEAREVAKSFDWNLVSEKLVNSLDLFLNS